jgi:hypothetical protein|tara:strand:+ start:19208 stop:19324 length:117 start_codon:yes stop_codon:yes gene_type:complete
MPTIKGGIKLGKNMSDEDIEKLSKAMNRPIIKRKKKEE